MNSHAGNSSIEARVTRKLQLRILPFVMLLYLVCFLDRANVGFAALSMNQALGLTPEMFGLGGGVFFIGYIAFQVPSNLMILRVGARRWIARVVVAWGIVSMASAFVVGPWSFYAMRLLLGVAEAGFFPGTLLYLNLWFPVRQRAVAIAAFMAAAPLSSAVGSPISGALMELPRIAGLANWQWLYMIEALPAILLGFLTLKVLTDSPEQAEWLSADECAWLLQTLQMERAKGGSHPSTMAAIWAVLRDPRVLALALIYSGTSAGLYAIGFWAPLLIRQFGFSALTVGWLNALPSAVAVVGMVVWARHSDRTLERIWHVTIPCVLGCAGLVWAGYAEAALAVILALAVASFGVNGSKPPLWAMPGMFLSGASAAAGIALINSLGNLGGFAGPLLIGWLKQRVGSYAAGLDAVSVMMALSAVIMLAMRRRISAA
ncbi:putative tartrate transporter [Candidatus Sulfotelmatomonas gaucii]|uniref:Putative tartrate transporter n=1 Tax=Candidatus Sulfuritelmatomonas gaucii TaxID=2043161 RepID=A0A2N9L3L8_9BACT|nr:putative tartrate transporter [Candidatus Sulfotelmatomonas gaucii]